VKGKSRSLDLEATNVDEELSIVVDTEEDTVVIVGGSGEGAARKAVDVTNGAPCTVVDCEFAVADDRGLKGADPSSRRIDEVANSSEDTPTPSSFAGVVVGE